MGWDRLEGDLGLRRAILVGAMACAVGCGDTVVNHNDGGGTSDTGAGGDEAGPMLDGGEPTTRDGGGPEPFALEITPPEIPWLDAGEPDLAPPILTPCADGWTEVDDPLGFTYCEPWAPGEAVDCGAGTAHFIGESDCAPVGAACPGGDFADGLPDSGVVYVLAGAPDGGDGSVGAPYDLLADVDFASLASGTVVALGAGAYAGPIDLPTGVTLWGACAESTVLSTGAADTTGVIDVVAGDASAPAVVRDIRIEASPRPAITATGGTPGVDTPLDIELSGVDVGNVQCTGMQFEGAVTLSADRIAVRELAPCTGDTSTTAIELQSGPTATVARGLFARNNRAAVANSSGPDTSLSLSDAVVRDHGEGPEDPGTSGYMVLSTVGASEPASVTANVLRSIFEGNIERGASIEGPGAELTIMDSLFRDGHSAFSAKDGGQVTASRSSFIGHSGIALYAEDLFGQSRLYLEDAVIAHSSGDSLQCVYSVHCSVRRSVFLGGGGQGEVLAIGADLVFEDARIGWASVTDDIEGRVFGSGILISALVIPGTPFDFNGSLELRRIIFERLQVAAITAVGGVADGLPGESHVLVEDVLVRDVAGANGWGLSLERNAHAIVRRTVIERAGMAAASVTMGSTLSMEDAVVRLTQGEQDTGIGGRGLDVTAGSSATLQRVRVQESRDVGVYATGAGSTVELGDVTVSATAERACANDEVACTPAGHGIGVYGGATLRAERTSVRGADLCGVQLGEGAEIDLRRGEVAESLVGLCLQAEPYDLGRVTERVRYEDNGTNMQATRLPIPQPL